MTGRTALTAVDAILDATLALTRSAKTVDELGDVAGSALRVLDEAASDAFYACQDERRDFYVESAGDQLVGLRRRAGVMGELCENLAHHLDMTDNAIERANDDLGRGDWREERVDEVVELRSRLAVLGEVVALARPVLAQLDRHVHHVAEASDRADALALLDTRVRVAGSEVARAEEDISMMRTVIESAQSRARSSPTAARSLSDFVTRPATDATSPSQAPGASDAAHRGRVI